MTSYLVTLPAGRVDEIAIDLAETVPGGRVVRIGRDGVQLDEIAVAALRNLPPDSDGTIDWNGGAPHMWIGGYDYPVTRL